MTVVAEPEFFEVTAQLLPVLVLASALETRLRLPPDGRERHRAPGPGYLLRRLTMLAMVSIGEIAALTAVAGRPTALQTHAVVTVLGVLGVLIIAPYAMEEVDVVRDRLRQRSTALRVVLVTVATIVTTLPLLPSLVLVLVLH